MASRRRSVLAGGMSAAIAVAFLIADTHATRATPAPAWTAGAAAVSITPPPFDATRDLQEFPEALCPRAVYNGQRLFDFQEPYQDMDGDGFFDYTKDAYCDANANGRYDGLYSSGGVDHLFEWVHDDIWARALAISDGSHTIVIESITSQGLMNEDIQRIRAAVEAARPAVGEVFASSTHNESSPDPIGIYGAPADPTGTFGVHSGIDDYYISFLVQQSTAAAESAVDAMRPAVMKVAETTSQTVRARLSTTFLTTDAISGPTNGNPTSIDPKLRVLQFVDASTGQNIETLLNLAAHNQQSGHADDGVVYGGLRLNRAITDDWPGVFAHTVESTLGAGRAMFLVGDNGSIEDPHLVANPNNACPALPPAHPTSYSEGCVDLPQATGSDLAQDVLNALPSGQVVPPHALTFKRDIFDVPLQNQLFVAAFGGGLFAHRHADPTGSCGADVCFSSEVGLIDFGPQLEVMVNPGEAYPAEVQGHPFGIDQISCPARPNPPVPTWHLAATHRFQMGLGDDMIGYEIPGPGWFGGNAVYDDPNCQNNNPDPTDSHDANGEYHKLESESVGPDGGTLIAQHLTQLADCAAAGTLASCSSDPGPPAGTVIQPGRFLLSSGQFTRRGADGPVGMWLLPDASHSFTSGTGTVIALAGIGAFGSVPVNATGVFIDYDGEAQTAPNVNTRGMRVTTANGSTTLYYMDPYPVLSGSAPGPARHSTTVTTTVIDDSSSTAWNNAEQTGAVAHDTAAIGGQQNGLPAGGSVTYSFFSSGSCAGSAASTQTVNVNGDGSVPASTSTGPLGTGTYAYRASYGGDANYVASTSACEPFTVHGWTMQSTPNPGGASVNGLYDVACPSSSQCTAVGSYKNSSNVTVTLAERWNGSSWATQSTPNPAGSLGSALLSDACPSTTLCTAVGYYHNSGNVTVPLAMRWNGSSWTVQTAPMPAGAQSSVLADVACSSSSLCTAVGYTVNGAGVTVPLAERWNGTSWSMQPTPNPSGATAAALSGVACPSSTVCTAVGYDVNSSGATVSLAERWNGSSWTVQATPNPGAARTTTLLAVACPSTTVCTAVGKSVSGAGLTSTLAERWSSGAWSVQATPSPSGSQTSIALGVACPSTSICTAVGYSVNSAGVTVTLAERWSGSAWVLQSTPSPAGARGSWLYAPACSSTSLCTAVGYSVSGSGLRLTLAERYA